MASLLDSFKQKLSDLATQYKQLRETKIVETAQKTPAATPPAKPGETVNAAPVLDSAPATNKTAAAAPVASDKITDSVGEGGKNLAADVLTVKKYLNKFNAGLDPNNVNCGPQTIAAIKTFQQDVAKIARPDGLISPNGVTWKALTSGSTTPTPAPIPAPAPVVSDKITDSVGEGGKNIVADVLLVKKYLNKFGAGLDPDNTNCGPQTIAAIKTFQQDVAKIARPDGLISPNGATWKALTTASPSTNTGGGDASMETLAKQFGLEVAVVLSIQEVETGGKGFLADGRPKILFEGHIFWKQLKEVGKDPVALQKGNEDILYPKWDKSKYAGGVGEYPRLEKAIKIDKIAALKSASWGEYQIMGFNHKDAGYPDVESFVEAMKVQGGTNNIKALLNFLKNAGLLKHVQGEKKDWAKFAEGYNGPAYAQNKYDTKLEAAYKKYKK